MYLVLILSLSWKLLSTNTVIKSEIMYLVLTLLVKSEIKIINKVNICSKLLNVNT